MPLLPPSPVGKRTGKWQCELPCQAPIRPSCHPKQCQASAQPRAVGYSVLPPGPSHGGLSLDRGGYGHRSAEGLASPCSVPLSEFQRPLTSFRCHNNGWLTAAGGAHCAVRPQRRCLGHAPEGGLPGSLAQQPLPPCLGVQPLLEPSWCQSQSCTQALAAPCSHRCRVGARRSRSCLLPGGAHGHLLALPA